MDTKDCVTYQFVMREKEKELEQELCYKRISNKNFYFPVFYIATVIAVSVQLMYFRFDSEANCCAKSLLL